MRANSGLMSTIVGSLPGNIALKYILSNLDEKPNTHIYLYINNKYNTLGQYALKGQIISKKKIF